MAERDFVLSLFPGIDMLGRAFEAENYTLVRGPDLLWGQRIEEWASPPFGVFAGVIGGSPCQDFSKARRTAPTGNGDRAIAEFRRVVTDTIPLWWLMENVPGVPDLQIDGYTTQRFHLSAAECGIPQRRLRCFQFGYGDDCPLVIRRGDSPASELAPCVTATEGKRQCRRSWADVCRLQGLPADFDLPGWSVAAKYKAVGNGVPIPMGRVVAASIRSRHVTRGVAVCACDCGRPVAGKQRYAEASCRKRMERRRRLRLV